MLTLNINGVPISAWAEGRAREARRTGYMGTSITASGIKTHNIFTAPTSVQTFFTFINIYNIQHYTGISSTLRELESCRSTKVRALFCDFVQFNTFLHFCYTCISGLLTYFVPKPILRPFFPSHHTAFITQIR